MGWLERLFPGKKKGGDALPVFPDARQIGRTRAGVSEAADLVDASGAVRKRFAEANAQGRLNRIAGAVTQPVPFEGRVIAEQYGRALGIEEEQGYRTETGTPVIPAQPRGRDRRTA